MGAKKFMGICYYCGNMVPTRKGSREHIVPRALLKDVDGDWSDFVIPKENAHQKCNKFLADRYEHDFCQILFYYTFDDKNAQKHVASKMKNLKYKLQYARKQFDKMELANNLTQVDITDKEKKSFKEILLKITKGLFFKQKNAFLVGKEYGWRYCWDTFNLEHDQLAKNKVAKYLKLISSRKFIGNSVFKYRFVEVVDSKSSMWELLFYNRFPAYIFLIHSDDEAYFNNNKVQKI